MTLVNDMFQVVVLLKQINSFEPIIEQLEHIIWWNYAGALQGENVIPYYFSCFTVGMLKKVCIFICTKALL